MVSFVVFFERYLYYHRASVDVGQLLEGLANLIRRKNFAEAVNDLNKPISEDQISLLEKALSIGLPEEFISFLKHHNGQAGNSGWIIDGSELLSSERIVDE